jgi:hypothetical protein
MTGHQWVLSTLGVRPKSSWSVDPFGHGGTFPYILKSSGIDGMVIMRIHYAWKEYFAIQQTGDFMWQQRWDQSGNSINFEQLFSSFVRQILVFCRKRQYSMPQFSIRYLLNQGKLRPLCPNLCPIQLCSESWYLLRICVEKYSY